MLLTHLLENGSTQHPLNLAVCAIKFVHNIVGLPDPTKKSYVSSIQEAARKKASQSVNRKNPITKAVLKELCEIIPDLTDLLIVRKRAHNDFVQFCRIFMI